jgi:tRNA pseudouridine38-40 synthase
MPRYFIEVAYKGSRYSGFQVQENANTIQSEMEKAITVLNRVGGDMPSIELTGSSRTDAGVHAMQNYFHFDLLSDIHPQFLYKVNAILPPDIVVNQVMKMPAGAHSRFDAVGREYEYRIYSHKNPFLTDTAYYYPYKLDKGALEAAAEIVKENTNFFAFAKTNSQVKTFDCSVIRSEWEINHWLIVYHVSANRFLRGMVRLLTGTMLKVGRGKMTVEEFAQLFTSGNKAGYSVPAKGLFLKKVSYPEKYFL